MSDEWPTAASEYNIIEQIGQVRTQPPSRARSLCCALLRCCCCWTARTETMLTGLLALTPG